jgi:hypothetical protein
MQHRTPPDQEAPSVEEARQRIVEYRDQALREVMNLACRRKAEELAKECKQPAKEKKG